MTAPSREHALDLLRQMLLIRHFEEKAAELYTQQKIRGFLHLYIGEEAVAVGVMQALEADDAIVATYREHGHALARGISPGAIMAEMYGKQEGCSRGRGGSMHLFDATHRFYGGGAIVGGGLPVTVGLALADKMLGRQRVSCCFFGEGAAAEGEFHESLNLAALWKLPVLFICENNLYAMGSALSITESQADFTTKAAGYGVAALAVNGMDVLAVEETTRTAVTAIRAGQGPFFIEARTYRFRAHSMFDAELYRPKAEIEDWKKHGPLITFTTRMKAEGVLTEEDFQSLTREVQGEVEKAVAFAEAGTWEPVGELMRFVHSERQNHGNEDQPNPDSSSFCPT
jgi:pyruvate dehydrogenase E1 component alpha subunit